MAGEKELWFGREEFVARIARVQDALRSRSLDALLAFQPESVTWLTGFYTRAYGAFQFAIVPASGEPVIVCREHCGFYVDLRSAFDTRRMWKDAEDPMAVAVQAIADVVSADARFGLELSAWQLTAARFLALHTALPRAEWVGVGNLVDRLRLVKSPAELAYQRRAATAAQAGMRAGIEAAGPGTTEREVAAAVCSAMILAGSDDPGPGVLSSGERAFHLHGGYGDRCLEVGDTLQLETTPNVRQYHARFMRTIKIGRAADDERRAAAALIDVQDRAIAAVAPGVPASKPDRIYRDGIVETGLTGRYTNKTFYSVGLILRPSGGEGLEATEGADWRFESGMSFHTYLLVNDFGISETVVVTEEGAERLTHFPRELIVA